MVDIDEYLSTTTLAEKSKKTYKQAHKKLTDGLENSIIESSQRAIIQTIPTLTPSLNSQQALINIAIILFRANGKKLEMLDAAREATKQKIIEERNKGNAVKLDTLPSRKQIDDYLNKLYNDGEWRSYVINYLLANIYVRNKDVNALIVDRVGKDKNENYVVNRKNDVLFVRRDYKTKGTYGEKQNQIKSAKLKKAVEELQKESEQKETPLLAKINGQRIGDDSLTNYIKERTKNNITESDMMKITINQIDETGDLRKLKMISDNRGTSIRTLIDNYNLKGFATEDVEDGKVKVTNDKGMDLMVTVPVPPKAQDTPPPPKPLTKWEEGLKSLGEHLDAIDEDGDEGSMYRWIADPLGEPDWDDEKKEWKIPIRNPPKVIWYWDGESKTDAGTHAEPKETNVEMWDAENGVWLIYDGEVAGNDLLKWKTTFKKSKVMNQKTGEIDIYTFDKETNFLYDLGKTDKVVGEMIDRGDKQYVRWFDPSRYFRKSRMKQIEGFVELMYGKDGEKSRNRKIWNGNARELEGGYQRLPTTRERREKVEKEKRAAEELERRKVEDTRRAREKVKEKKEREQMGMEDPRDIERKRREEEALEKKYKGKIKKTLRNGVWTFKVKVPAYAKEVGDAFEGRWINEAEPQKDNYGRGAGQQLLSFLYEGEKAGDIVERKLLNKHFKKLGLYTDTSIINIGSGDWKIVVGKKGKVDYALEKLGKNKAIEVTRNDLVIYDTTGLKIDYNNRDEFMKLRKVEPIKKINLTDNPNLPLHDIEINDWKKANERQYLRESKRAAEERRKNKK